jgi:putative metalloprotease
MMMTTGLMRFFLGLAVSAGLVACVSTNNSLNGALSAGSSLVQAATLSDAEIVKLSEQSCAQQDVANQVAPAGSDYDRRLQSIVQQMAPSVHGQPLNYKVYLSPTVNAWAMGNGCVRVYSGLLDKMNDDEVRGVVGHEIGHVALGHSRKAMQVAYAAQAARQAAGGGLGGATVAALSQSQLGDVAETFVEAQFSQSQESAADDYSYEQLKARGLPRLGLATAFEKLAAGEGGNSLMSRMFSSHPDSAARAAHIRQRIAADAG